MSPPSTTHDRLFIPDMISDFLKNEKDEVEVCFMHGSMGKYDLDHNMGRQIDLRKAVEIFAIAHDQGFAASHNPSGISNCCGGCCGRLTSLK